MYSWEELRNKVNNFISELKYAREPLALYDPIIYTLEQGGKRVRPVALLMAYNLYKEDVEQVLYPAVAMETYHNYTLLHDDVMDKADVRRGMPTVWKKWGENEAILSGDTMFVLAYEFLSHVDSDKLPAALALFNEMAKEIGEGQQYDMEFENRNDVKEEEYINMIRLKTSVLIANCMKLGAMLAGASKEDAENLYRYGVTVGLAFQLQDDLLDVYGDPKVFGKKIGGDICCNKKTFLLINALEQASPEQRREMEQWMAQEEFDADAKIKYFTSLYNTLGIRRQCEEKIATLFAECDSYLDAVSVPAERKSVIKSFADSLLNRIH
ncbi:MAG: polyprenyl synthetase family protein [Bacteroidaceae bacterium]|nr:polyprenyl synthetase family protein [Bacteroidaceae bacterium]MBQ4038097.1 polyprenyl synthetase family protein [Bacteroidaceae bacterium]